MMETMPDDGWSGPRRQRDLLNGGCLMIWRCLNDEGQGEVMGKGSFYTRRKVPRD